MGVKVNFGDFAATTAELVPMTAAARDFLSELAGTIGMPAPVSVTVRKSAVQRVLDLAAARGLVCG